MAVSDKMIVDERSVRPFVSPQQKKQRRTTVGIVIVALGLAAGAYFLLSPKEDVYTVRSFDAATVAMGPLRQTTQASGTITIPAQIEVRSSEAGFAKSIYVTEGDFVSADVVLAEIEVPDLEASLSDLLDDYETDLLNYEKSVEQRRISTAKSERGIADLEEEIMDARTQVEKLRRLVAIDSSTQSELDGADEQLQILLDRKEEAQIDLGDDQTLNRIDTAIQDANLAQTERELRRLEERISSARITSAMSGEVLEIDPLITVPGSIISANQSIMIVADPESIVAELEILEQYAGAVEAGDIVELTVSSSKMQGVVQQVGRVAQSAASGLGSTIMVRVKPVDPPPLLAGATAVGTFVLGLSEGSLTLPRGPYLTTGSQRYVYVIEGASAVRREVTFGQIEGNTIEVISGLQEGDQIIVSGYQNFIEYETLKINEGDQK